MRSHFPAAIAAIMLAGCTDTPTASEREAAALAWISQSAAPLIAVAPAATTSDLAAMRTMIGSARVIGLGEATHGSREFFTMKDRLFRYLVEESGVTAFAIEATMPEAFALDNYVRTGSGNPAVLLSHLYFWTWNTQEVADLITALRAWNQAHPAKQVGFYGFDMQYPGIAIDSVTSYVARVAPGLSATIAADYACLANYRNDSRGVSPQQYTQARSAWAACTPKVADVHAQLESRRGTLVSASSARDYELALQMARVVEQWELAARVGSTSRDVAMAENVAWLLDREGPDGKLFLWAHNGHVARLAGTMGSSLHTRLGSAYLPIGFAFGAGGLNAIDVLPNGALGTLKEHVAPPPMHDSYEQTFERVPQPNYAIDLRQAPPDVRTWLTGPRLLRSVGAAYSASRAESYFTSTRLADAFDVLIFIRATTPSVRLPFQF